MTEWIKEFWRNLRAEMARPVNVKDTGFLGVLSVILTFVYAASPNALWWLLLCQLPALLIFLATWAGPPLEDRK